MRAYGPAMPRYHFHIFNTEITRDDEGLELADDEAARREATRSARELICQDIRNGYMTLSHRIEVEDAQGEPVLMIHYREVFDLRP